MSTAYLYVSAGAGAAVRSRYQDAYIVARAINGFGDTIKGLGLAIGAVLAFLALLVAFKGGVGILVGLIGVAVAGCVAAVFYLFGILVSAQGQILKATLDTAVNSSTFLTNDDRADVMSLPKVDGGQTASASVGASRRGHGPWKCGCGQTNDADSFSCISCGLEAGAA